MNECKRVYRHWRCCQSCTCSPGCNWEGHSNSSIFRAEPDGRWTRLSGGLPQPLDYAAYALLTDPHVPGHLYEGLSNGEVWHTGNYGDHWQRLPFKLAAVQRSMVML